KVIRPTGHIRGQPRVEVGDPGAGGLVGLQQNERRRSGSRETEVDMGLAAAYRYAAQKDVRGADVLKIRPDHQGVARTDAERKYSGRIGVQRVAQIRDVRRHREGSVLAQA